MRCLFCIGSGSEPQHPPKGLTLLGRCRVRDLEHIALGGVDNGGVAAGAYPGQLCIVIQVYVPVDEPFRLVLVQNLVEALKAPVGTVVPIVQSLGRGVGQLLIQCINGKDMCVVQACVVFISLITIVANLVADILYALIDPRIRY